MCFRIRSVIDNYYLIQPFLAIHGIEKFRKPIIAHDVALII